MDNSLLEIKKRIKEVRLALKKSQEELANAIGTDKTTISKIENPKEIKRGPSLKIIMGLESVFNVNRHWLETGDGDKFKPIYIKPVGSSTDIEGKVMIKPIPYFDIDASAGDGLVEMAAKTVPDAWLKIPGFKGCDLIINVRGDSMMGKYNSGDLIALKHIKEGDVIHWGACHVIVTGEQAFIKYLRYDEADPEYIILRSHNEFYQDQRFHKSKIKALFIVKGKVERSEL